MLRKEQRNKRQGWGTEKGDIQEVNGEDCDHGRNGTDVEGIKKGNRDKLRVPRYRKTIRGRKDGSRMREEKTRRNSSRAKYRMPR